MDQDPSLLPIGRGELLVEGDDLAIIAIGVTVYPAMEAALLLKDKGINAAVINARFVKPLDRELILSWARRTGMLVTAEENALAGGFGSAVLELLEEERVFGVKVKRIGIPDRFIEQGSQEQLRKDLGFDAAGIAATIEAFVGQKGKPSLAKVK
jgi:1-deoxy-D-xylulose-5-phosphate synthase